MWLPPSAAQAALRLLRWWRFYRQGLLPKAGGLLAQNPQLLELFDALDGVQARIEADKLEAMRAKAQGTGRINKTRPKRRTKS